MSIEMFLDMVATPVLIILWVTVIIKTLPIWLALLAVLTGKK
jgi:hypothetical protein